MRLRIAFFVSLQVTAGAWRETNQYKIPGRLFAAGFNGGDFGEIGREIVRGKSLNVHFD